MNLTPSQAGFIKGLGLTILLAILSFFTDAANLTGIVGPTLSALIVAVASAIESSMKADDNGETGLFGTVSIKK